MTKGNEGDRRQLHALRKAIEGADLPERKALIKLARKSDPAQLKAADHSLYLAMQKIMGERTSENLFRKRSVSCLELPEEIENKLLDKDIDTVCALCDKSEKELNALGFDNRETSRIREHLGEVGLTFAGELGPFGGPGPE